MAIIGQHFDTTKFPSMLRQIYFVAIIAFGSWMVYLGCEITYDASNQLLKGYESALWPTAEGTVSVSKVLTLYYRGIKFSPEIKYTFRADGKIFSGERVEYRSFGYSKEETDFFVNQFPKSSSVRVYYMQDNPAESTLITGVFWPNIAKVLLGFFICVFIGGGQFFLLFRIWKITWQK